MSDRKILIADYNTRELQRLQKLFEDSGYAVATVLDGKAALDKFAEWHPDAVLLSAMLSKVNGFDACRQIKESEAGKNIPVVIATSVYKGEKYRLKALHENHASDFIEKPVEDSTLLEVVRRVSGETTGILIKPSAPPPVPPAAPKAAPRPVAAAAPAPAPSVSSKEVPTPKAPPVPASADDVDALLREEVSASLATARATAPAPRAEDNLDKLLSDTLSGIGLNLDLKVQAPPQTPPVRSGVSLQPDSGEMRMQELESLASPPKTPGQAAVESLLGSFDTDLERKLSDTLSGVGLTDNSFETSRDLLPPPVHDEGPEEEGVQFGDYLLVEKIGHGGMAELYRAKKRGAQGFQKILAIKRILPNLSDNEELVTMFIDEAKIAAQLTHQNIANIFDFGEIDGSYYIAMEYVDGFDLKKVLSRAKEYSIRPAHKLAALIALQICAGLDYAHHKKDFKHRDLHIVHRDVSPQNIILSREGEVKLVDFGISKAESKIHHTVKGALKGKLLYMSPEQAWGKKVDKRSDIYSLGIVLAEMVTGKVLFEDSSEFDVLEKVRSGRIPVLESELGNIPPRIKAIIDKALQIEASNRYLSAAEMAKELRDYLNVGGAVPAGEDLASFLHRLFPDDFGLGQAEVANLRFEQFDEPMAAAGVVKAMSKDTVLLEKEDLADLDSLVRGEGEPTALISSPSQRSNATTVVAPVEEIIYEDEAVAEVSPKPAPQKAAPAKPEPPRPEPKPEPRSGAGQAPEKRGEVKAPPKAEPKAAKPEPKAPAPESKPKPTPVPPPTPEVAPRPSVPTPASSTPTFGMAPAKPSGGISKPMILAGIGGVVVVGVLAMVFFGGGKDKTQPVIPAPTSAPEAVTPSSIPAVSPAAEASKPAAEPAKTAVTPPVAEKVKPTPAPRPTPVAPAQQPPRTAAKPPQAFIQAQAGAPAAMPGTASPKPAGPAPAPLPVREEPKRPQAAQPKAVTADLGGEMKMTLGEEKVQYGAVVSESDREVRAARPIRTDLRKPAGVSQSGRVICRVLISPEGDVEKVVVISADNDRSKQLFGRHAEEALKRWKYQPAEKNGVKVRVWKTVPLVF